MKFAILNAQLSSIKYIHNIIQPLPLFPVLCHDLNISFVRIMFFNVCFFGGGVGGEKEKEQQREREVERGRQTIPSSVRAEPNIGLELMNHELTT